VPALRGLSARHLRHLLRPWLDAGWTPADVLHALDHTPADAAHTWTTDVRSPRGWLAFRLGMWTDAQGRPLRALSIAVAERAAASRAAQAAARAETREVARVINTERELGDQAAAADPEGWAELLDQARRQLGRKTAGEMAAALARATLRKHLSGLDMASHGKPDTATAYTAEQLAAAIAAARDGQRESEPRA